MNSEQDFITAGELEQLRAAPSQKSWDSIVAFIQGRRGGLLPPDWQVKVVASGLEFEKQLQFTGQKPIEKIVDPAELRAELTGLLVMQEDLFQAMLAIQTAIGIRSADFVTMAISTKEGFVVDVVVHNAEGQQVNQRTAGKSHIEAIIACGKQCHAQLLLLHQNTGKLQSYVDRVKKLDEIRRQGDKKIIAPSGN